MAKNNPTLNGLLGKLKVETIAICHRSPLSKLLCSTDHQVIYRLPFDDYGDLTIDNKALDFLFHEQEAIESMYGDRFNEPDGQNFSDAEYETYCEWLAIKAVRNFIGV